MLRGKLAFAEVQEKKNTISWPLASLAPAMDCPEYEPRPPLVLHHRISTR